VHGIVPAVRFCDFPAMLQRSADGRSSPSGRSTDQRAPLRLAASIALAAAVFMLALQMRYAAPGTLPTLLLIYALHVAVTAGVLLATFALPGGRRIDALTVVFVLGLTLNLLLYLFLMPAAVPTYPALLSNAFTALLIAGAVLFSWSMRRTAIAAALTCGGFGAVAIALAAQGHPAAPFVLTLGWLAVGAVLAVVCARVLGRFRASLLARQDELAALSARLISVLEEQLHRLSRELHDELGQSLTAVSTYLWLVEKQLPPSLGELRDWTTEARRLVAKTLGEMRELSQFLRPPGLDLYGLGPSVEGHVKSFGKDHGILTQFVATGLPARLPEEIETAVYRIAQEALTNIARHARARNVRVRLEGRPDEVGLEVQDDGVGLPAENGAPAHGLGLIGIRERVRVLGGTASITSAEGTRVSVTLPLPTGPTAAPSVEPASPPAAREVSIETNAPPQHASGGRYDRR